MIRHIYRASCALVALSLLAGTGPAARAITGYGVNSAATLFSFDVDAPAVVTTLGAAGAVGFVPEGIDFRPGTSTLYAIDVGPNTSQLYTIDITTGVATTVGAAFTSSGVVNGVNYNLGVGQSFGFDFNPTTLQADGSMRIRLIATNNSNLRLNSSTGQVAAVDGNLAFAGGSSPFADAAAYINNNAATMGGTTALYDMDSRNNALLLQSPPNNGTVATVGTNFGVGIDAQEGIHFDIFTTLGSVDTSIGGDRGLAVFKRPDAPQGGVTPVGSYLLYDVNLGTGVTTMGRVVGPAATPFNFDGGFAVLPIPEPTGFALALVACAMGLRRRRA
jgi:hypothetical protein